MKIKPEETELLGKWIETDNGFQVDIVAQRINWLVSNFLIKIKTDESGWDILYKDPIDGRYWELFYPESGLYGGGPPALKIILKNEIVEKYNYITPFPARTKFQTVHTNFLKTMENKRKLTQKEYTLLKHLIDKSSLELPNDWVDDLLVSPMNDSGMGSLYLIPSTVENKERVFGKQISELHFKDKDNVMVIASLNVDANGKLYELDIWKTDYSKLIEIPTDFDEC